MPFPVIHHCELRHASPSLRSGLISLWKECFPLADIDNQKGWDEAGATVLHCSSAGKVVGSVLIENYDDENGPKNALRRLAVSSGYRCRGLGGTLVIMAVQVHQKQVRANHYPLETPLFLHVNYAGMELKAYTAMAKCNPGAAMPTHSQLTDKERCLLQFYRANGFDDIPDRVTAEDAGLDWDDDATLMVYKSESPEHRRPRKYPKQALR